MCSLAIKVIYGVSASVLELVIKFKILCNPSTGKAQMMSAKPSSSVSRQRLFVGGKNSKASPNNSWKFHNMLKREPIPQPQKSNKLTSIYWQNNYS